MVISIFSKMKQTGETRIDEFQVVEPEQAQAIKRIVDQTRSVRIYHGKAA